MSVIKNFYVEESLQRGIDINDISVVVGVLNTVHELGVLSNTLQHITGDATGFSIKVPGATLLQIGRRFEIINNSTAYISLVNGGGVILNNGIGQDARVVLVLVDNSTPSGVWNLTNIHGDAEYEVSAQNTVTTTSATYELVSEMSVVIPKTGTYYSFFNADTSNTNNGTTVYFSFFLNGIQIIESERRSTNSANLVRSVCLQKLISVIAGQTLDVRWYRSAKTQSLYNRTLTLLQRR